MLRGEVRIELEPVYGFVIDDEFPLETNAAYRRALEQAALFFSGQIYGWSFHYEIGERARNLHEIFEMTPLGEIQWGDPRLFVTHAYFQNPDRRLTFHQLADVLTVWVDYRPSDDQRRRLNMWRMGNVRNAQAIGFAPPGGPADADGWFAIRHAALEDAARAAVRGILQGRERNRPREATGFISLQGFPHFFMDAGRVAAQARFRVEITEIIPFAVH